RMFIFEWGPEGTDGLMPAFRRHIAALEKDGLQVELEGPEGRLPLARSAQMQLYGIAREALANVVKHSGSERVRVRVAVHGNRVRLEIEDDGCGFDPSAQPAGHFGLDSMRSRAEEIGGVLEISSGPGRGTALRVIVPAETGEPA
ncbi:MAG TPA: ATP-binding protein, partial [Gaiellaceae bacterium]|nr:ATP-binding protein [Gaiellaceae bacterium]